MPVIHEKVGGALYIVSRLENQKHCTWQVSSYLLQNKLCKFAIA